MKTFHRNMHGVLTDVEFKALCRIDLSEHRPKILFSPLTRDHSRMCPSSSLADQVDFSNTADGFIYWDEIFYRILQGEDDYESI